MRCLKILTDDVAFGLVLFVAGFSTQSYAEDVAGSGSGSFTNPQPSTAVTTGVGTSSFTWGVPVMGGPSQLDFEGETISASFEEAFSIGVLSYFNGTIEDGTQANTVDLDIVINLTMPNGVAETFTQTLTLINTPNTSDPIGSADIVRLPTSIPEIRFNAGGIEHTLRIEGFGTITGSGGTSTIDRFFTLEGESASAELLGTLSGLCPAVKGFHKTLEPIPGAGPGGSPADIRYKSNVTPGTVNGTKVGIAVTLCNPNAEPLQFVMCSMANRHTTDRVIQPKRIASFSNGRWTCNSSGESLPWVPGYHFGCQNIELAPGQEFAAYNDGGVLGSDQRTAPYIDFLRHGDLDSTCTALEPNGVRGANQFLIPDRALSSDFVNTWTVFGRMVRSSPLRCDLSWPAGSWETMGEDDSFLVRLVGTIVGAPTGSNIQFVLPEGNPTREVNMLAPPANPVNPTCLGDSVNISIPFVIPPEPTELRMIVEVPDECSDLRESSTVRLEAKVVGDDVPNAPKFSPGEFVYENTGTCVVDQTPPEVIDMEAVPNGDGTIDIQVVAIDAITQPLEAGVVLHVDDRREMVALDYDDPPVRSGAVRFRKTVGPFPDGASLKVEPLVVDDAGQFSEGPIMVPGDIDGDDDVDLDDINIIIDTRGAQAKPFDQRDVDADGIVSGLDARRLVFLCTRSRCDVQ